MESMTADPSRYRYSRRAFGAVYKACTVAKVRTEISAPVHSMPSPTSKISQKQWWTNSGAAELSWARLNHQGPVPVHAASGSTMHQARSHDCIEECWSRMPRRLTTRLLGGLHQHPLSMRQTYLQQSMIYSREHSVRQCQHGIHARRRGRMAREFLVSAQQPLVPTESRQHRQTNSEGPHHGRQGQGWVRTPHTLDKT